MNVDNLNLWVILQMLAQLGDIHIHRTSIEVVVVYPDCLQGKVTLQNLIGMRAEQRQQFILLGGQLSLLLTCRKQLLLGIESKLTDVIQG